MPLSSLQSRVLAAIACHRSPESFVAGASPLTRSGSRTSEDIDVFNDRVDAVEAAARADVATLEAGGFAVRWLREDKAIFSAQVAADGDDTRLEWVTDSDFRFFPAVPDPVFGYMLHLADIATNKALAAVGRREPRDMLDLLHLHERYLPLGAIVWAAVNKDIGFTPEGILAEMRRSTHYRADDFDGVVFAEPVDLRAVAQEWRQAMSAADEFVREMPAGQEGLLYISGGRVVQPDPDRLDEYEAHAGRRRGHWPGSAEITNEMLSSQLSSQGTSP